MNGTQPCLADMRRMLDRIIETTNREPTILMVADDVFYALHRLASVVVEDERGNRISPGMGELFGVPVFRMHFARPGWWRFFTREEFEPFWGRVLKRDKLGGLE